MGDIIGSPYEFDKLYLYALAYNHTCAFCVYFDSISPKDVII